MPAADSAVAGQKGPETAEKPERQGKLGLSASVRTSQKEGNKPEGGGQIRGQSYQEDKAAALHAANGPGQREKLPHSVLSSECWCPGRICGY